MISVLASSAVDHRLHRWCNIYIDMVSVLASSVVNLGSVSYANCCLCLLISPSVLNIGVRAANFLILCTSRDWLTRKQDTVSDGSDMRTR